MMLSKADSGKDNGSDSSSARLLLDIKEINRALYPHKPSQNNVVSRSAVRTKSAAKTRFAESNSNLDNENLLHKNKKSSIWNWKPVKALTHIRNHRFNCCFFLHVHSIEGLSSNFDDISLCVHWKRKKDRVLQTRPARVCQGVAEFEETLMHRCSVYGRRNGSHCSDKYEPKLFLIYVSVTGAPDHDLGKHWIDLARLLSLTLDEEKSSRKWTTNFKLSGKAKGAILNVGFGFSVMGDSLLESGSSMNIPFLLKESTLGPMDRAVDIGRDSGSGMLRRIGSVPSNSNYGSPFESPSLDVKLPNEDFPYQGSELAQQITFLYQKLDESKSGSSVEFDFLSENVEPLKLKPGYFPESSCNNIENLYLNSEFAVIEQGIELSMKEQLRFEGTAQTSNDSTIEIVDLTQNFNNDETVAVGELGSDSIDKGCSNFKYHFVMDDGRYDGNGVCTNEIMIDKLDSVKHNLSVSESGDFDNSLNIGEIFKQENDTKNISSSKAGKIVKSRSLDDVIESVANDFLKMLAVDQIPFDLATDSETESPRELLLRQFEAEALSSTDFILNFDSEEKHVEFSVAAGATAECRDLYDYCDSTLVIEAAEEVKAQKWMGQSLRSRRNAKLLENLETEALMKKWGLNEHVFQNSPQTSSDGFGSPIYLPPEEPLEFPPLGEGLGPILQTEDGGFLRSMNPSLFRNVKNGGRLIMQVSPPVVLPVAMGSSIMEILQHWASVGFEKMSMQVNKLTPLVDINGKMMQQLAWKVASRFEAPERLVYLQQELEDGQDSICTRKKVREHPLRWGYKVLASSSICGEIDSDYVSLEDLAPLAMEKIEALSIEGLRIHSGMSDEEAPSSITPQSIGKTSAFLGNSCGPFILEGAARLKLLEAKDEFDDVDELIGLCVTLNEWMRFDSGDFGDDGMNERSLKVLSAHLAENIDIISGMLTSGSKWDRQIGRSCGLLGNNLTVLLRVQLRNPLRDYETVSAPMLALIEVERAFVDMKPKVNPRISERSDIKEEDDLFEQVKGINAEEKYEKIIEEGNCLFKISEVHMAGFNTEPRKQQQWSTTTKEQSGVRWLLASRMGKNTKHLSLTSNAIVKSSSQDSRKMQPRNMIWSISSHVHSPKAKWKELATLNLHVRNPDVVFLT